MSQHPLRLALVTLALLLACACGSSRSSATPTDGDADTASADGDSDAASEDLFTPDTQTPFMEQGLIIAPHILTCTPYGTTDVSTDCNNHAAAVMTLPNGHMGVLWYHGMNEGSQDSLLLWSKVADDSTEWSFPRVVYDDPIHSDGNATLYVDENGVYYIFVAVIMGPGGWDEAEIRLIRSTDEGSTWSDAETLEDASHHFNARHRPLAMDNGEWLLPLYNEQFGLPVFLRSHDRFATWTLDDTLPDFGEYLVAHGGQIQPSLISLGGGHIVALTRDGMPVHRIGIMESTDYGVNWTDSVRTVLPNSGTSIDQVRLKDGHVVVVFNNSPDERRPLNVALSRDGDQTFVAMRTLRSDCLPGETGCDFGYPSITQNTRDGSIWVAHSYSRSTIAWEHFNEAWLLAASPETLKVHCIDLTCHNGYCRNACATVVDCESSDACTEGVCLTPCSSSVPCAAGSSCGTDSVCAPDDSSDLVPSRCI